MIEFVGLWALAFADDTGGIAADNHTGGNIFGDDGSGGDDGTIANGDTGKNQCAGGDPNVVTDDHRAMDTGEISGVGIMIGGQNHRFGGDVDVVADGDVTASVEGAVPIDNGVVADGDVAVGVELEAAMNGAALAFGEVHGMAEE